MYTSSRRRCRRRPLQYVDFFTPFALRTRSRPGTVESAVWRRPFTAAPIADCASRLVTPQSYAEAQADAVPPYWETTVHAPAMLDPSAYMIVDELPSGSVITFLATTFISYLFQFAGFVLTYLLHTTHAAKYGSRAGLGVTLIQFGLVQYGGALRNAAWGPGSASDDAGVPEPTMTPAGEAMGWNSTAAMSMPMMDSAQGFNASDPDAYNELDLQLAITSRDWIALILMTLGTSHVYFRIPRPQPTSTSTHTHLPPPPF